MAIEEIFNQVRVSKRIATSGQPLRDELPMIAEAGYQVVINLAMHDSDDAIADEGSLVAALGLAYVHLPVPFEAPTREHLVLFLRIMQSLRHHKVWVHCAMNYRVSAFMYQYLRVIEQRSSEEAQAAVFSYWRPDAKWQAIFDLEPGMIATELARADA